MPALPASSKNYVRGRRVAVTPQLMTLVDVMKEYAGY